MRCTVRWNPGQWPYVTRCDQEHGHEGEHRDPVGRTIPNVPGQEETER